MAYPNDAKGQPFKPDAETAKTLEQSAKDGYAQMQNYFVTPGKALAPYWSGNQWQTFNIPRDQLGEGFPFETADELLLDERAGGSYFWLSFFPKHLGAASFYLVGLRDRTGAMFNGQSLYRAPNHIDQWERHLRTETAAHLHAGEAATKMRAALHGHHAARIRDMALSSW